MPEITNISETYATPAAPAALRRIAWGAIFAGAVVMMAVQLLLNMLGIGIGASTIDPAQGETPDRGLAIGATIWFLLAGIVALFVGGWTAGRLAGLPNRRDGMLHGFVTWGLATLVTFFLLTTVLGSIMGGAASLIAQNVRGGSPVAGVIQQQTGINPQQIQQEAGDIAADPRFSTFVRSITVDGRVDPKDRQALVRLVEERKGVSSTEAQTTVSRWEQQMMQAREQARQYGDVAARNISRAALASFFMLLLGAAAATVGGGLGAPKTAALPTAVREPRRAA